MVMISSVGREKIASSVGLSRSTKEKQEVSELEETKREGGKVS